MNQTSLPVAILASPLAGAVGYGLGAVYGYIATALLAGKTVWVLGTVVPKALNLTPVYAVATAIQLATYVLLNPIMGEGASNIIGIGAGWYGAVVITHFPGGVLALALTSLKLGLIAFVAILALKVALIVVIGTPILIGYGVYKLLGAPKF